MAWGYLAPAAVLCRWRGPRRTPAEPTGIASPSRSVSFKGPTALFTRSARRRSTRQTKSRSNRGWRPLTAPTGSPSP